MLIVNTVDDPKNVLNIGNNTLKNLIYENSSKQDIDKHF